MNHLIHDLAGNLDCRSWNPGAEACNAGSTTYADFSYGPNRERVRTTEQEGSAERVIYHVGPHFEVECSSELP